MRILVCGGRHFNGEKNYEWMRRELNALFNAVPYAGTAAEPNSQPDRERVIIHGGATGADNLATRYATEHGCEVRIFAARWDLHGRSAGPRRNLWMLAQGKPHIVIAFPGGRGTADMVHKAQQETARTGVKLYDLRYGSTL